MVAAALARRPAQARQASRIAPRNRHKPGQDRSDELPRLDSGPAYLEQSLDAGFETMDRGYGEMLDADLPEIEPVFARDMTESRMLGDPTGLQSLYSELDTRLDRAEDGAPLLDPGARGGPPSGQEALAQAGTGARETASAEDSKKAGEEKAEKEEKAEEAEKAEKEEKKEEAAGKKRAADGDGKAEGPKPADKKKAPPKGTRKTAKLVAKAEEEAGPPQPAPLPEIPEPEIGLVPLAREPPVRAEPGPAFSAPDPPEFRPARAAGAKPEPPGRDAQLALTAFREAVATARRFHEELTRDAAEAAGRVQASAERLADLRQRDLDTGLDGLARALADSRMALEGRADAADRLIDKRERATRAKINAIARAGLASLGGAKGAADKVFIAHGENKDATKKSGRGKIAEVERASGAASRTIKSMVPRKEELFSDYENALEVAKNEKIKWHLAGATGPSAEIYDKEGKAEIKSLTGSFDQMDAQLEQQFKSIGANMTSTATSSAESMTKVRDSSLRQAKDKAEELHGSVAQSRAGGHAALVKQHNVSRGQLIASQRDRARGEAQAARQRGSRGANAFTALAGAQQTGARALATTLAKESARPPAELARVMSSSASSFAKQVGRTRAEQRPRLTRSSEGAEPPALAQGDASSARAARTAAAMAARLQESGESASTALTQQIEKAVEPFDKMDDPVIETRNKTVASARASYAAANQKAGEAVNLAEAAVVNAWLGTGGGDKKDAPPAAPKPGEGPGASEKPFEFVPRADKTAEDPEKNDEGIKSFLGKVRKEIGKMVTDKNAAINKDLTAASTPVESVLAQLRAITAKQGAALIYCYRKVYHRSLTSHLDSELRKITSTGTTDDANVAAAMNYLRGNHVEGARQEMKAAVNWSNDEGRVERVQRMLTPAELGKLNDKYADEMEEIVSDLGGNEEKAARALNQIRGPREGETKVEREVREAINIQQLGVANALGLQKDIDEARKKRGEAGGDKTAEAVEKKYQEVGTDILSGFDPMEAGFEDSKAVDERKKKLWEATGKQFGEVVETLPDGTPYKAAPGEKGGPGAIARYAAAARTYTEYVPNEYGEGYHTKRVSEGLDRNQTELIDAIVREGPDSPDAAAATIMVEMNRKSGPPREDKLRKALGSDMLAAVEGEGDADRADRLKDQIKDGKVVRKGALTLAKERREKILARVGELDANARSADQPAGEGAKGPPPQPKPPEEVKQQLLDTLDTRFTNDPTAKAYTRSMLAGKPGDPDGGLEPDPVAAFEFAIAHEGKNKETLLAATGRMNRQQIDDAVEAWDVKHPQGPKLYEKLGLFEKGKDGILEGDARNEVEIKFMGVPRNDKERAEVANMATKQQVRDAGIAGPGLAAEEYQRMLTNQNKLLGVMGVKRGDIDEMGRIKATDKNGNPIKANFNEKGELVVKDERDREGFETLMQLSTAHAEQYKQTVDKIAMGITMALMVVAAVVTTFLTAGGAAAIWGPILITAGAGLVGMGMTAAIRGDRYTTAEMQRDLVMTLVQAATAGLGAYAGTALKGAGAAAKAAASAPKVVGAVQKPVLSLGAKALNLGKEVVIDSAIGGTTNAINSAAGAAVDPENRRQGKSAEKAMESGFKGFISGAAGSALTKPMGDAAKKFKGGALGERMAGNVAGGFTTRLTEARVGQAMGDPHQSWAESLEVAKEGIAQDVIQAAGEHGAHRSGEKRAARKAAAKIAAAEERAGAPPPRPEEVAAAAPALADPDRPVAPAHPSGPPELRPPPPGPRHTPESMERAAAVHEALPADIRPAVEAALPARPPAPDPDSTADIVPARPPDMPASAPRPVGADVPATRPAAGEAPARPVEQPLRPGGEKAGPAKAVRPDEAEAAAQRRPGPDEAETAGPRRARPDEEEGRYYRSADDISGPDEITKVTRREDLLPTSIDLKPGMLGKMPEIPHEMVIRPVDPKNGTQALENYHLMRTHPPAREVLLAYNPTSHEYMVIQGQVGKVKAPPEGWQTVRHSHGKLVTTDPFRQLVKVLPSGIGGDFTQLGNELDAMPGAGTKIKVGRSSVIDIEVNGTHVQTTFEITREGDNYTLSVTIDPPVQGLAGLGPFSGKRAEALEIYAQRAKTATSDSADFGLDRDPADTGIAMSPDADDRPRVVRGATPGESERHNARFVAERMAQAEGFDQQARGLVARGEFDPVIARAAASGEAHARLRDMGLVGQPDSLQQLTRLLNSSDPAFTPEMRAAVARATLEATRAELKRTGGLGDGDELLMLFRGVTAARTGDYEREGIDLSRLGPGGDEDAGRGLYGSQDFQSAQRYTGGDGQGTVLPLIVRRSELGNVIDVRSGTPLGDRWLAHIRATAGEGRMMPSHPHLSGVLDPRFDVPLGLGRGGRGTRFENFLATLAADPTLPPAIREAARDPHITLMDLGGVASWGNDRSMLTDQFAMHHQRIADLFNEAHGLPRPRTGGGEGEPMYYSAVYKPKKGAAPAAAAVPAAKPPAPAAAPPAAKPPAPAATPPAPAPTPAPVAPARSKDPSVAEADTMMAALATPHADNPKALIAQIAAGGPAAAAAQARLDAMSSAPRDATVVNITQAEIDAALPKPNGKYQEARVTIGGLEMRVYRSASNPGEPVPPARFEATLPPSVKGQKPVVYQLGDGELRAWRSAPTKEHPAGVLTQEGLVGPRRERSGDEDQIYSHGEGGYAGSALERAHLHGAGRGRESPFGIGLAPREVNQVLQSKGIEAFIGRLRDALPPGAELLYETNVTFHSGTSRQARIGYRLDIAIEGRRVPFAEFAINIDTDRPGTPAKKRKGTTGISVEPLQWRHSHESGRVNRLFGHLREAADMPQVLQHGMPRKRPPLPAVLKLLGKTRPEDIERAANESGNRLAAHRPPPTENFELAKWRRALIARLNAEDPPQLVVIDTRELNLTPAQIKKIEKALAKLPPEQRAKIVWLE